MINKNVHLIIIGDDILFAEEPFELLMLLYAKDKQYKTGAERVVDESDFTYWLTNLIFGKFKLIYTEKALEHIIKNIKNKNKRVKAFKEEVPILLFNELYLRTQPEILYAEVDKDSIQGLIDLLMLKVPDKEYAVSLINQLVDFINHDSFGSVKIKS